MSRFRLFAIVGLAIAAILALAQSGDGTLGQFPTPLPLMADGSLPEPGLLGADPRCTACNVILISIDTLRADHVGFNGYPRPTTPNLDRFSRDAVNFRAAFAAGNSTLLSHSSLFTGLIPVHHGAFLARKSPLPDEALTLAEALQAVGYRTAAFTGGGQLGEAWNVYQGFDHADVEDGIAFEGVVRRGLGWLAETSSSPFFLFLHSYEVHAPYEPSRRHREIFEKSYDGPLPPRRISVPLLEEIERRRDAHDFAPVDPDNSELRHIVNLYDAEIRSVDEAFATLVEGLRDAGIYDDTLLIVTADHGEEFGEHGKVGMHSTTLFDELIRVPLLVKFPASTFASLQINEVVGLVDLFPTILDVLELPVPERFARESLLEVIRGTRPGPGFVISQRDQDRKRLTTSVRTHRWKLVDGILYGEDFDDVLYDLATDPDETLDVSARHPWVTASLLALRHRVESRGGLTEADAIELDEELMEQLRGLGYIR